MKPAKVKTTSLRSLLGGRNSLVHYELDTFGTIILLELTVTVFALYWLVFHSSGLSTVKYLGAVAILWAFFEHGRALAKRKKWAYGVCFVYGAIAVIAGATAVARTLMSPATGFSKWMVVAMEITLLISSGLTLMSQSRAAMRETMDK